MGGDDEHALLLAVGRGSSAAFGQLVDRHQQPVRAFLRRLGHDHADADDLAQETFMALWSQVGSFRGGSTLRTWLCAIAWRKSKSARRGWFRRLAREGAWREHSALEAREEAGAEDSMALTDALSGLPLEQRAALALCLGGDFSNAEAAQALGLPLGTVKSHVSRGRVRMQQMLGDRR